MFLSSDWSLARVFVYTRIFRASFVCWWVRTDVFYLYTRLFTPFNIPGPPDSRKKQSPQCRLWRKRRGRHCFPLSATRGSRSDFRLWHQRPSFWQRHAEIKAKSFINAKSIWTRMLSEGNEQEMKKKKSWFLFGVFTCTLSPLWITNLLWGDA